MTLNDIQLSGPVVAGLYPHQLVETEKLQPARSPQQKPAPGPPATPPAFKFLGNNKKQVLVAVNYPNSPYLPDDQLTYLTKILNSCALGLEDIALVNLHHHLPDSYKELAPFLKSKVLLLFGITAAGLGLPFDIPNFQVQGFQGYVVLQAPALEDIPGDPSSRYGLWTGLKKIFNL